MKISYEEYQDKLRKLRINREKVPLQVLQTKYKEPYRQLLQEIKKLSEEILKSFVFGGMKFDLENESELKEFISAAQAVIDQEEEVGTFQEISQAVFQEYDAEKMLDIAARKILWRVWYEAYAPYWIKHCILQCDGNVIWNDLIKMKWDAGSGVWTSMDGESFTLMLPPTRELIKQQRGQLWEECG